ncbi:hypothetical protein GO491_09910 [Flavobacteriaceae bacterium Ap0902]|nr:hypothetical protein [Flavobacteriaceae bacterium Ap0902]
MKSAYQFESAQDISPEILEAIKTAFGNRPVRITIESMGGVSNAKSVNASNKSTRSNKFNTEIAESVIDIILAQLNKKSSKKS